MKIAFYAPFKPMDHPNPSGDRVISRSIVKFLEEQGHSIDVQSRARTRWVYWKPWKWLPILWDIGVCLVRLHKSPPHLWLTYHTYYKAPDIIGPVVCGILKIPYVIFCASYATQPRKKSITWPGFYLNRHALMKARHIFINRTRDIASIERLIPKDRLTQIIPGVDIHQFHPTPENGKSFLDHQALGSTPTILTAAMFRDDVKTQGLVWLIHCCAILVGKNIDFHLVIAGDGVMNSQLREEAQKYLPNHHRFTGSLNPNEMQAFYASGDLFAFPGINEAIGMVFLEAQACGLPVVAFDTCGIPDVVTNKVTGFLTPEFDKQAFASALEKLIINRDMAKNMGTRAREVICERHSLENTLGVFEKKLQEVAS